MLDFFKDAFHFTRAERNGVIILLLVIVLLIIIPFVIPTFIKKEKIDFSEFAKEIEAFEKSKTENIASEEDSVEIKLFIFDPNELQEDEFRRLGLSERVIKNILSYRAKGGKFRKPHDLQKIYGLDENTFQVLLPYIFIPEIENREANDISREKISTSAKEESDKSVEEKFEAKDFSKIIELNTADSAALTTLRNIGPAFARRIVNYREKLGGFVSKEQLLEVYGMDSARYFSVESYVEIDIDAVRKIKINSASVEELQRHPYIDWNLARAIFNYRQQHGNFQNANDLRKIYLMNDELLQKLEPYFSFE